MQRAFTLRKQAKVMRDLAAHSATQPEIFRRLLRLAQDCEDVAELISETIGNDGERQPQSLD